MIRKSRAVLAVATVAAAVVAAPAFAAGPPAALDAQNWSFQDNLTWSDYKPIPGPDYSDASIQPSVKKWKVALILVDYPDRPFTISEPAGSTVFGTPSVGTSGVPREQVPQFYADFLNKPSVLNNRQTLNRYWMEDSFGKYGVDLVPYGPYRMPQASYKYHISRFNDATADCPLNPPCDTSSGNLYFNTVRDLWNAAVPAAERATYDNAYYVSAGADESATWQEFGEMRFVNQDAVTDPFGPKHINPAFPRNWALTRYVPWTSWAAANNIWPSASGTVSTEAESSGMGVFAHELSHNLSLPDNYGNPFGTPAARSAGGMWDMMSRGSFNGPGGQHTRWLVPPTQGASLGAQHGMRHKQKLGFVTNADVLRLNRDGLAQTGMAVAEIKAREAAPNGELFGMQVLLNGAGDTNPPCRYQTDPTCEGPWYTSATGNTVGSRFNDYTVEVVQKIGADSFVGGHGVLLGKTKNSSSTCSSFACSLWYIDANPQDINQVDYLKADGTPVKATIGDERQLNDGTFHAGTNSGSKYEYTAAGNNLQFYILNKRTGDDGVLRYTVGVRSLAGSGPQTRGVALSAPVSGTDQGFQTCTFTLKNTGAAAATPNVHPQDASAYLNSDIYRLSASASGTGWTAHLRNALATAKFGESTTVTVYIEKALGAAPNGSVSLTATSESDPSKTQSATCSNTDGTVGGAVPATLALTLGTPASFGAFTPGAQRDYFATQAANVISTAGDATLSVADPSSTATGHLVNGAFLLPEALQAAGSAAGTYAPVGGSANPTTLKTYAAPVSNDAVTMSFKQPVKATDALRTGAYAKTLTFTLSTTNP